MIQHSVMRAKQTEPNRWSLRIKLRKKQSRSTSWRESLKELQPDKYAELRDKDRVRKQMERRKLSMDESREARMKKKLQREQTAFRVRQFRLRKKAKDQNLRSDADQSKNDSKKTSKSTGTLQEEDRASDKSNRRAYMREYMRSRRSNMSRQKKQYNKLKDRARKNRSEGSKSGDNCTVGKPDASSTPKAFSRQTRNKIQKKITSQLPSSPSKFAVIIDAVANRATPRKKRAMKKLGLLSENNKTQRMHHALVQGIRSTMTDLGKKQNFAARAARNATYHTHFHFLKKYRLTTFASRALKLNCKSQTHKAPLFSLPKKAPSRKLPQETEEDIEQFYIDSSTSRPEKKFKGKKLMSASLRGTYKKYTKAKQNPVSWSTFRKLRPSTVCKLVKSHLFVCQCAYCINIQFKLNSLNMKLSCIKTSNTSAQDTWVNESKLNDVTELMDVMMCEKQARYNTAACINDTCPSCNDKGDRIKKHYAKLLEDSGDDNITWKRWERQKITQKKKVTEGDKSSYKEQEVVRRVLISRSGTIKELCDELVSDALHPLVGVNICQHLFTAQWQNDQYRNMKENMDENTVLMVLDFGENITTKFQDEIKSAHYGKKQITVHPIVAYYKEGSDIVRDAMIMLSDNLQHDHHAVHTFLETANQYLTQDRQLLIQREIHFTDGAASQYKCASSFADISYATHDFDFSIQRCFYGSEHGKGESDGETGTLKAKLDEAVRGQGVVINNAKDLYNWASQEMTDVSQPGPTSTHTKSRRTFFLVEKVIPTRRERTNQMATLPQTRKVHSVRSTGFPNQVETRNLTCFCVECLSGKYACCANKEYVTPWKMRQLHKKKTATTNMKATTETAACLVEMSTNIESAEEAPGSQEQLPEQDPKSQPVPMSLERDQWVAVIYDDVWWPGIIQIVKKDSYFINFMKPVGENKFVWPTKVDSSEVNKVEILTSISEPPFPATSRYYSFEPSVASSISSKMIQYLKKF